MVDIIEFKIENKIIKIVAVSVMGRNKIENQDSYSINFVNNKILITLADGLGSAVFSKEGSEHITKCSISMLINDISQKTILDIKTVWKKLIKSEFDKYDTTFKFLKIDNKKIEYGGIGDGWICGLIDDSSFTLEANQTFSNQTDTILSTDLLNKFKLEKAYYGKTNIFLIATDGFSEDMKKAAFEDFLNEAKSSMINNISSFANELNENLENWPVSSNTDDKSVIFVSVEEE